MATRDADPLNERHPRRTFVEDVRRLVPLAWPVLVGQVAVLGFATIDTALVARHDALDLAALAIGIAAYITTFIGPMGVVLAVGPIAGKLFGARRLREAGAQMRQAVLLAIALALLSGLLLVFPQPFLGLAHAEPAVAAKTRHYLLALAFALPPALMFTAFRGFNVAVSRPKAVMALQLAGLALKIPASALLIGGFAVGPWQVPAFGVAGCGIATAVVMWCQWFIALAWLRRSPFYAPFGLQGRLFARPDWAAQRALLRLGVPLGLAVTLETTAFAFVAFFISRLGAAPVAGHQIAMNLVSLMFMLPLAIGNAACTLVAQRLGAGDSRDARRLSWHSVELGLAVATALGALAWLAREPLLHAYTDDPVIFAAALPLLAWVMLFHIGDAGQTLAAFVLRAYHLTVAPMWIYAVAMWGVGLGCGHLIALDLSGLTPPALRGAPGYWAALTAGVAISATALVALLGWVLATRRREERRERGNALSPG